MKRKIETIGLIVMLPIFALLGCQKQDSSAIAKALQCLQEHHDVVTVAGWKTSEESLEQKPFSVVVTDRKKIQSVASLLNNFLVDTSVVRSKTIGQVPPSVWRIVTFMNFENRKTSTFVIEDYRLFLDDGTGLEDADPKAIGDLIVGPDFLPAIDEIIYGKPILNEEDLTDPFFDAFPEK